MAYTRVIYALKTKMTQKSKYTILMQNLDAK